MYIFIFTKDIVCKTQETLMQGDVTNPANNTTQRRKIESRFSNLKFYLYWITYGIGRKFRFNSEENKEQKKKNSL